MAGDEDEEGAACGDGVLDERDGKIADDAGGWMVVGWLDGGWMFQVARQKCRQCRQRHGQ
jgi:hypothetical protein